MRQPLTHFVLTRLYHSFPYPDRRRPMETEVSACHFDRRFNLCSRTGSAPLRGHRGICTSNITDVACDHELAVGISVDTDEYVLQIPLMLHVIPDRQIAEPTLLRSPCLCGLFGLMPFEMAESTFFNGQAVYAALQAVYAAYLDDCHLRWPNRLSCGLSRFAAVSPASASTLYSGNGVLPM